MEAAKIALASPSKPYLLHIDEINRADLGKILGEAIYLLEPEAEGRREIDLAYDYGAPFQRTLYLADNLHILGTMNSADRSIAIVDVAVRRRFAFWSLWPSLAVVREFGCELTVSAFEKLVSIFIEHAPDDAFELVPGHSTSLKRMSGARSATLRQAWRRCLASTWLKVMWAALLSRFEDTYNGSTAYDAPSLPSNASRVVPRAQISPATREPSQGYMSGVGGPY